MTDTAVHAPVVADHGHATSTGLSNTKLAMWVYLGSDCLLFGTLISTYLLLRHRSVGGSRLVEPNYLVHFIPPLRYRTRSPRMIRVPARRTCLCRERQ